MNYRIGKTHFNSKLANRVIVGRNLKNNFGCHRFIYLFPQNVIKRHIRNIRSDKSCDNLIRYDPRISISSLRFNPSSCDIWHPNCWGVSGSIDDRKNEFDQITKGVRRSLFSQGLTNLSFQHFSSHFSSTTTAWATFNKLYEARLSIEYSIHVLNDIRVDSELGWSEDFLNTSL